MNYNENICSLSAYLVVNIDSVDNWKSTYSRSFCIVRVRGAAPAFWKAFLVPLLSKAKRYQKCLMQRPQRDNMQEADVNLDAEHQTRTGHAAVEEIERL